MGLRARTTAVLPRVKLPEVILEVMSWVPEMAEAFTAVSGGRSRLKGLPVSIAACLAAHSINVGYPPIAEKGVEALERSRLSHVFQNYFRPETLSLANAPMVPQQADLLLAQAWGGGLVAAVDGMRFVVPVPAAFGHPTALGEAEVPLRLIMGRTHHKNPRTAMRYVEPGAEAIAKVTEVLAPRRRTH